jgi:hypothetical protein
MSLTGTENTAAARLQVRKRSGALTDYAQQKINQAVLACLVNGCNKPNNTSTRAMAKRVADRVDRILQQGAGPTSVEQIQDLVEQVLMGEGEHDAARQYILYRAEHQRLREQSALAIDETTRKRFIEAASYFQGSNPALQMTQAMDKFARFRSDLGGPARREVWPETVQRVMDWFYEEVTTVRGATLPTATWEWLRNGLLTQQSSPAMRVIQLAGAALSRCSSGCYNCSYMLMDSPEAMAEDLYLLMQGCGVGFSVESSVAEKWPRVLRQTGAVETIVVPDTTEGWCDTLKQSLHIWLSGGDVNHDTSLLRPEGAVLKTKGGTSSGPGPLKDLLRFAKAKILARQGQCLTSLDIHDITCFVHRIVQMGGVRRASGISLSDLNDVLMRDCKSGNAYATDPQRNQANNSAAYDRKPEMATFMTEWTSLVRNKSGERGIFNREGAIATMPARRRKQMSLSQQATLGTNPCLTGDTLVYVADGRTAVSIKQLAEEQKDVPVFCLDGDRKLTIRYMRHPRITGFDVPVMKVTLDDGSIIRVTPNHRFMLRDGTYRETRDLRAGDSLRLVTRVVPEACSGDSRCDLYTHIRAGERREHYEHVMIAAFATGRDSLANDHVHHKDEDKLNNTPANLEVRNSASHLSEHSAGEENPEFCGVTTAQLIEKGCALTRSLGRRFSTAEWVEFAVINNLPQHFSAWRQKAVGSVAAFSRLCCAREGLEAFVGEDPRVVKTYHAMLEAGLDAEILDGTVIIHKSCEFCGCGFTVEHVRREQGYCSQSCSHRASQSAERLAKQKMTQRETLQRRKAARQEQQLEVYTALKAKLRRLPEKKEWQDACRAAGVVIEMCRPSSPFQSWKDLKAAALTFNHRVVVVEPAGCADVYNGTVDDFHNFLVGGFDGGLTPSGRRNQGWIVNAQCGEIVLPAQSFCNLSMGIVRPTDTVQQLEDKIRQAAYWGTLQSMMTRFNYLRDGWRINAERERLLGVDMLGHLDHPLIGARATGDKRSALLRYLRDTTIATNQQAAQQLGINASLATTCNKPSGDSSVFYDTAAGFKAHHGKFWIRRLRFKPSSPIARLLKDCGVPYAVDYDYSGLMVFDFPCKAPAEDSVLLGDMSAIEQLEHWKDFKLNWTEHNPSVSIFVKDEEWLAVGAWVYANWDIVGGLSFFPFNNDYYPLLPYEAISETEYAQRVAAFPSIEWAKLPYYEIKDMTELKQHLACAGGACEI